MAQIKKSVSVTNGSQTVTVTGVDLTQRIKKNAIFMVEGELAPYTIAIDSVYDGSNTVATLTGKYQGATSATAAGVFAVDFTFPDMIPTIAQGDVGTAAVFTQAMYRLQSMVSSISSGGTGQAGQAAQYASYWADVNTWHTDVATWYGDIGGWRTEISSAHTDTLAAKALAQKWASQATGTVDGTSYSAKYYADQAATYSGSAGASATLSQNFATSLSNTFTGAGGMYGALKYANDANASALLAKAWASQATGVVNGTTLYSAAYYAQQAASSAAAAAAGGGSVTQIPADWNQSVTTASDYIKNKPDISAMLAGFGIGGVTAAPFMANLDDVTLGAGMYYTNATTTGSWPNSMAPLGGFVLHKVYGSAGFQLLQLYGQSHIFYRSRVASAWGTWTEMADRTYADSAATTAAATAAAARLALTGGTLTGTLTINTPAPAVNFVESDQTGAAGKWRLAADGAQFRLDRNTDAAGNYATTTADIYVSATGLVSIPQLSVATSAVVPDRTAGESTLNAANTKFVTAAVAQAKADLINSAPGALDTLNELATALGNDPNFSATITTSLGNRLRVDTATQGLNAGQQANARANIGLDQINNVSDQNKPISDLTQAALNLKLPTSGGNLTGALGLNDQQISRAMLRDCAMTVATSSIATSGSVVLDYTVASVQALTTTATGMTLTLSFTGWPPAGNEGMIRVDANDFGSQVVSIPGVIWTNPNGSETNSLSSHLAALSSVGGRSAFTVGGLTKMIFWCRDATTVYGKFI